MPKLDCVLEAILLNAREAIAAAAILPISERRNSGAFHRPGPRFRHRVANGMAEGFNNVVGTIKKQAYGFHDRDYLKLKILRICGKLE